LVFDCVSQKLKRMGSAEEELCDREARYTKLRLMRVEMCCIHWNGWLGKIGNEAM